MNESRLKPLQILGAAAVIIVIALLVGWVFGSSHVQHFAPKDSISTNPNPEDGPTPPLGVSK